MSMRVDPTIVHKIVQRWDREETQGMITEMSRELTRAAESGKIGRNDYAVDLGLSLAASVRDPIFWNKVEMLLCYRFDA